MPPKISITTDKYKYLSYNSHHTFSPNFLNPQGFYLYWFVPSSVVDDDEEIQKILVSSNVFSPFGKVEGLLSVGHYLNLSFSNKYIFYLMRTSN